MEKCLNQTNFTNIGMEKYENPENPFHPENPENPDSDKLKLKCVTSVTNHILPMLGLQQRLT